MNDLSNPSVQCEEGPSSLQDVQSFPHRTHSSQVSSPVAVQHRVESYPSRACQKGFRCNQPRFEKQIHRMFSDGQCLLQYILYQ